MNKKKVFLKPILALKLDFLLPKAIKLEFKKKINVHYAKTYRRPNQVQVISDQICNVRPFTKNVVFITLSPYILTAKIAHNQTENNIVNYLWLIKYYFSGIVKMQKTLHALP